MGSKYYVDNCDNNDETQNKSTTLGRAFFHAMTRYGEKTIQLINDTGESDSYSDLLLRCIRTSLRMRDKGIRRSDIISCCSYNQKNSCVPFIATQFLGAKSTYFDPDLSHLDTIRLLKLIQPKLLFVSENRLEFMQDCIKKAEIEIELVLFENKTGKKYNDFSEYLHRHKEETFFEPAAAGEMETAVILFSSGTTGFPKGICLSHHSLITQSNKDNFMNPPQDTDTPMVSLMFNTLYWISAVLNLTRCLLTGSSRVICEEFDGALTWKLIEKYRVTVLLLNTHQAAKIIEQRPSNTNTDSLMVSVVGGSAVSKELMQGLKVALPNTMVLQLYGQTETAGIITAFDITKPEEIELQNSKPLSCGKIRSGYTWKIVDISTEATLGPNERGELRLRSGSMMNGYFQMDSSDAYDSQGFLKTGDMLFYDEADCFYVVDRVKEIFKFRGWHILPALIEEVLSEHPAVKDAVVLGIPHEKDGEHPMGVVALRDGFDGVSAEDLQKFVDDRVSDSQRLRGGIKITEDIPRTCTGKIKRRELKEYLVAKGC